MQDLVIHCVFLFVSITPFLPTCSFFFSCLSYLRHHRVIWCLSKQVISDMTYNVISEITQKKLISQQIKDWHIQDEPVETLHSSCCKAQCVRHHLAFRSQFWLQKFPGRTRLQKRDISSCERKVFFKTIAKCLPIECCIVVAVLSDSHVLQHEIKSMWLICVIFSKNLVFTTNTTEEMLQNHLPFGIFWSYHQFLMLTINRVCFHTH